MSYEETTFCLFDPIFRGSRHYFDRLILDSIRNHFNNILVFTRCDHKADNNIELATFSIEFFPCLRVTPGSWYETIATEAAIDIGFEIQKLIDRSNLSLFFCGINELGLHGLDSITKALQGFEDKQKPKIFMIEYKPSLLLQDTKRISALNDMAECSESITLFVLESSIAESIRNHSSYQLYKSNVFVDWLPDPPPLSRSELVASPCTWIENHKEKHNAISVLTVGTQSPRKGVNDLIRASRLLNTNPLNKMTPHIFLSGTLDLGKEQNSKIAPQILKCKSISWRNTYVSDKEILSSYCSADYIILPYNNSFEGSSGVFAYASAFRKPIVATSHGCIGSRVLRFGLGFTYKSGDYEQLASILLNLPSPNSKQYEKLQKNNEIYSMIYSKSSFKALLLSKVCSRPEILAGRKDTINYDRISSKSALWQPPKMSKIDPPSFIFK